MDDLLITHVFTSANHLQEHDKLVQFSSSCDAHGLDECS